MSFGNPLELFLLAWICFVRLVLFSVSACLVFVISTECKIGLLPSMTIHISVTTYDACTMDQEVRFTRPSPTVLAYCKQSKTGEPGKALERGYLWKYFWPGSTWYQAINVLVKIWSKNQNELWATLNQWINKYTQKAWPQFRPMNCCKLNTLWKGTASCPTQFLLIYDPIILQTLQQPMWMTTP